MAKKVSILVGSLRKGSFARKVAQNVIPMFPEGYEAQIVEIGGLPLYNFDYDDPAETDFPHARKLHRLPRNHQSLRRRIVRYLRKQPHCPRLSEKRGRHRLQTQRRRRMEKHARRHHQPFRRQDGRLQFAKKPAPCLVLLQYAADRTARSLPRQLPHPV